MTIFFHIIFYQDSHKKYSLQKMSLNVWSLQFSKQVPNGTFWPIWKMIPLLRYLEKVFHPWLILWKKWQFFFFYREAREKKRFRNKSDKSSCVSYQQWQTPLVESFQDFLFDLDMKPCMLLEKISIFSQNNVTVRPTKIMNRADKNWAHF